VTGGMRWRLWTTLGAALVCGYVTIANFVPAEVRRAHWFLPDSGVRLGLDLQGGIHWVLGAKLDVAIDHELDHQRGRIEGALAEDKITPKRLALEGQRIVIETASAQDLEKAKDVATTGGLLRVVDEGPEKISLGLTDTWARQVRKTGMEQVLEVLRRRIEDPINGIQDSVVTPQGEDRILVQIPGGQMDRARARELLRVTGFLEFKIVQDSAPSEELLKAKYPKGLPDGTKIVFEREKTTNKILNAYLVKTTPDITGDYLKDARVIFDQRTQRPLVSFEFSPEGGKLFGEITAKSVGRQLAIILDDQVYSAPAIRERIGSHGQIEGHFTSQEAADLAVVLRAGSLSIPVAIEEERTVGPALGADSIRSGLHASILALALVLGFAVIYYRLSGVYAGVALLVNLIFVIGLMSMFRATLTMPGIAGLVLTVGTAIDANVIIFERIREELRLKKPVRTAISTGFDKALWTILDANITTLISGIVLFQYGTGPVKGFAVTLCIGLVTSVFAALVVTRVMFGLYPGERRVQELSI